MTEPSIVGIRFVSERLFPETRDESGIGIEAGPARFGHTHNSIEFFVNSAVDFQTLQQRAREMSTAYKEYDVRKGGLTFEYLIIQPVGDKELSYIALSEIAASNAIEEARGELTGEEVIQPKRGDDIKAAAFNAAVPGLGFLWKKVDRSIRARYMRPLKEDVFTSPGLQFLMSVVFHMIRPLD